MRCSIVSIVAAVDTRSTRGRSGSVLQQLVEVLRLRDEIIDVRDAATSRGSD